MSRGWLVVFAKAPRAGLVKTRMSPPLSLEECAAFYAEMLSDVLGASARFAVELDLEPVLAFHPPDAAGELVGRAPRGFRLHPQRGATLAERMAHAVLEAGAAGAARMLIRGSDCPALPLEIVREVVDRLDAGADGVLTPDEDGGYTLVGLRRFEPRLFSVEMSTHTVLDETLARARHLGLQLSMTAAVPDVDTIDDARRLRAHVAAGAGVNSLDLFPRTVQCLDRLARESVL